MPDRRDSSSLWEVDSHEARARRVANKIATGALVVSILSAIFAAGVFFYPRLEKWQANAAREKAFVEGVAADRRGVLLAGMTQVQPGSPSERYMRTLSDLWRAAYFASRNTSEADFTARGGSIEPAEPAGYRVCMANVSVLPRGCHVFSDFIYNVDSGLIERFSIDGVPVDMLVFRYTDDTDYLGDEGRLKVRARMTGKLRSPDQGEECVSFLLTAESDPGKAKWPMRFDRQDWNVQDRQERRMADSAVAWPATLSRLNRSMGAVRVPSNGGGFVWIRRVKDTKSNLYVSGGWLGW